VEISIGKYRVDMDWKHVFVFVVALALTAVFSALFGVFMQMLGPAQNSLFVLPSGYYSTIILAIFAFVSAKLLKYDFKDGDLAALTLLYAAFCIAAIALLAINVLFFPGPFARPTPDLQSAGIYGLLTLPFDLLILFMALYLLFNNFKAKESRAATVGAVAVILASAIISDGAAFLLGSQGAFFYVTPFSTLGVNMPGLVDQLPVLVGVLGAILFIRSKKDASSLYVSGIAALVLLVVCDLTQGYPPASYLYYPLMFLFVYAYANPEVIRRISGASNS